MNHANQLAERTEHTTGNTLDHYACIHCLTTLCGLPVRGGDMDANCVPDCVVCVNTAPEQTHECK